MKKTKWTPEEVAHWQASHPGSFYNNKEDASLFVRKSGSTGFTLNLGNPLAWVFIVALNVLVALLFIL